VSSRQDLRERLLPVVPGRLRAIIATVAGAGLRWGEAAGLQLDVLQLDRACIEVVRTVVEVSGRTSFNPFPRRPLDGPATAGTSQAEGGSPDVLDPVGLSRELTD
jgi:integrase